MRTAGRGASSSMSEGLHRGGPVPGLSFLRVLRDKDFEYQAHRSWGLPGRRLSRALSGAQGLIFSARPDG